MLSNEQKREYNRKYYEKVRNDPKAWALNLKKGRERYKKFGHKKIESTCVYCGKKWMGTRIKRMFCSQKCVSSGVNNGRWLGGRRKNKIGYVLIYCPGHPRATRNFIAEHILLMEKKIGRFLKSDECVHHKDSNKDNNKIENLELITKSEHSKLHWREWKKNGNSPVDIRKRNLKWKS